MNGRLVHTPSEGTLRGLHPGNLQCIYPWSTHMLLVCLWTWCNVTLYWTSVCLQSEALSVD